MIRAKKMTDKVGLETFFGSHSIFVIIYETDRAKRFGSGRQGRIPVGESPTIPIAWFGYVAMPQFV
jgi:hypothetical protein